MPKGLPNYKIALMQIRYKITLGPRALRSPLWILRGDSFFRTPGRRCLWRCQAHLDLELLYQFVGLEFFGLVVDLDFLLIDIAHRHIHARFVDGSRLFYLAHHLIVRLADPGNLELLHRIGDLLLPLGAAVVGDSAQRLVRLPVLFAHKGLLHGHGLVEGGASGSELALISGESALGLL